MQVLREKKLVWRVQSLVEEQQHEKSLLHYKTGSWSWCDLTRLHSVLTWSKNRIFLLKVVNKKTPSLLRKLCLNWPDPKEWRKGVAFSLFVSHVLLLLRSVCKWELRVKVENIPQFRSTTTKMSLLDAGNFYILDVFIKKTSSMNFVKEKT